MTLANLHDTVPIDDLVFGDEKAVYTQQGLLDARAARRAQGARHQGTRVERTFALKLERVGPEREVPHVPVAVDALPDHPVL